MATTRKRLIPPKLLAASSTYIDPLECNSTVSYKVIRGSRRVWADVQLADCNRKIEWYFGGDSKTALAKIDKAIDIFQEFRDAFVTAQTEEKAARRRKKPLTTAWRSTRG